MDTGISILIYITYAYLYCLKLLLVTLDSQFIGLDHFMIIEELYYVPADSGYSYSLSKSCPTDLFCLYYII